MTPWLILLCVLLAHAEVRNYRIDLFFEDKECAVRVRETMDLLPERNNTITELQRAIPITYFPKQPVVIDSVLIHAMHNASFVSSLFGDKDERVVDIKFRYPQSKPLFFHLEYRMLHAQREIDALYSFQWDVISRQRNIWIEHLTMGMYVTTPDKSRLRFSTDKCFYDGPTSEPNVHYIHCANLELPIGTTFPVQLTYVPFDYKTCRGNALHQPPVWTRLLTMSLILIAWMIICWIAVRCFCPCFRDDAIRSSSAPSTPVLHDFRYDPIRYGSTS